MPRNTRAEARCRYLVREIAQQKGWNTKHPQQGGNFLEEQEIASHFPDSGLGLTKPDFLVCMNYAPIIVVEAKNELNKIDGLFRPVRQRCRYHGERTPSKGQQLHQGKSAGCRHSYGEGFLRAALEAAGVFGTVGAGQPLRYRHHSAFAAGCQRVGYGH